MMQQTRRGAVDQTRRVVGKDEHGLTPLHRAAGRSHADAVTALLLDGADPNVLDGRMGASPLHHAAQGGSVEVARLLLRAGAFLNLQAPTHGVTPLMVAVWHRNADLVAFFLQQEDVNVEVRSIFGVTARELTGFGVREGDEQARRETEEIGRLFEDYEARRAERLRHQPLFTALTDGDLSDEEKEQRVRALLDEGADPNTVSPVMSSGSDGHTPLLVAARDGLAGAVEALLAAGADQTLKGHYMHASPLHKASYMGHAAVIRLLAGAPGFRTVADEQGPFNGYTALHDATWHGHAEAVRALLDARVQTELRGFDGHTALDLARAYGYDAIAAMLADADQDASQTPNEP